MLYKLIAILLVVALMVLLSVFGSLSEFTLMCIWFFGGVPVVYFIWRTDNERSSAP